MRIGEEEYKKLPKKYQEYFEELKNDICTLKPISLLRYLTKLVTPQNGIVLDPFAGSGTTGIACIIEGFNYILIEKRQRFANIIISKRLDYWKEPVHWDDLDDHALLPDVSVKRHDVENKKLSDFD